MNYLLNQREYTFQLGDSMIVFWAESAEEEYQAAFFGAADPKADNQEEIKGMFENLKIGRPVRVRDITLNPEQKFYILSLAPNAARLSVRFFYQDSFGNILKNLSAHYERMSVVRPSWRTRSIWESGTCFRRQSTRTQKTNSCPQYGGVCTSGNLVGRQISASLYTDVLIRIRAEQGNITWAEPGS